HEARRPRVAQDVRRDAGERGARRPPPEDGADVAERPPVPRREDRRPRRRLAQARERRAERARERDSARLLVLRVLAPDREPPAPAVDVRPGEREPFRAHAHAGMEAEQDERPVRLAERRQEPLALGDGQDALAAAGLLIAPDGALAGDLLDGHVAVVEPPRE